MALRLFMMLISFLLLWQLLWNTRGVGASHEQPTHWDRASHVQQQKGWRAEGVCVLRPCLIPACNWWQPCSLAATTGTPAAATTLAGRAYPAEAAAQPRQEWHEHNENHNNNSNNTNNKNTYSQATSERSNRSLDKLSIYIHIFRSKIKSFQKNQKTRV